MIPYLETWARLRWLWVITTGIWLVVVVLLWRGYRPEYEAVARISIDSTIIHLLAPGTLPPDAPLATYRFWSLHDLLRSDSFIERVGKRTALSRYADRVEDRIGLRNYLLSTLSVRILGEDLLELRFAADPPELADQVMRAIVTTLAESLDQTEQGQGQLALSAYAPHLDAADRDWQQASAALRDFTQTRPELQVPDSAVPTLPMASLVELQQLQREEQRTRRIYEDLLATVQRIEDQSVARGAGLRRSIKLVDAPAVSSQPLPIWNTLGVRVLSVTVILLVANLVTIVLMTWSEAGLQRASQVRDHLHTPVLGRLPHLRQRRRSARRVLWARPTS